MNTEGFPRGPVLDAWSPARGPILKGCDTVKKWGLAEVSVSLGASLEVV